MGTHKRNYVACLLCICLLLHIHISKTYGSISYSVSNAATIGSPEVSEEPESLITPGTKGPVIKKKVIPLPTAPVPVTLAVTLFGYTSPLATVSMSATNDLGYVRADSTGYFKFDTIQIPLTTSELCLYAEDRFLRISQPTCIPFFKSYVRFTIGPILLSPTVTLNKSELEIDEKVVISGSTSQRAKVDLLFFQDSVTWHKKTKIPKKPLRLSAVSDELGNFSLAFSSNVPTEGRVIATSYTGNKSSAKSSSLKISFLPYWLLTLYHLARAFQSLSADILFILFLIECVGILGLIYYFFWKKSPPRALTIVEDSIILMKSDIVRRAFGLSKMENSLQKRE